MGLFLRMINRRKVITAAAVCSSMLAAAAALLSNALLSGIIDTVSAGRVPEAEPVVLILLNMLFMCAAAYAKGLLSGRACESLSHDMRMAYARHFASLPVAEAEALNAGEQLSKLQNELAAAGNYLNSNLFQLLDDGVRFLATFGWLLFINPTLTLAANVPALLILAYAVFSSKVISAATARAQQAKGQMNRHADTLLNLFPIIRLYEAECLVTEEYAGAVNSWEKSNIAAERTRAGLMSLSGLLSKVPLLFLLLAGGSMAIAGSVSIGTVYIFLNLSGNVSGVMMNMPGHIAAFRQFTVNMGRLGPYLGEGRD